MKIGRWLFVWATLLLGVAPATHHSRFLFVWAMEVRHPSVAEESAQRGVSHPFIAVFDVSSDGSQFGKLVAMRSIPATAKMVHHTNYALPANDVLFANDWLADRTYTFDLHDPASPQLIAQFRDAGPYMYPHSFVYLSNGKTLATFQYTRGFNRGPGGLVERNRDELGNSARRGLQQPVAAANREPRAFSYAASSKMRL